MLPSDLEVFLEHRVPLEKIPRDAHTRRAHLNYFRQYETPPPRWIQVSGLFPDAALEAPERRRRVRILYKGLLLVIRRELKRHEVDPYRAERSVFWDPVSEICLSMEIAPSKLSAFCKELTGNSLSQVIDSVRAETLKRKLRDGVRGFVASQRAILGTEFVADAWAVWGALKRSRRWPEFSRDTWAQEFGFSSYRKMYRACQVVYGMTPHQLEMALIAECLAPEVPVKTGPEFEEVTLDIVEAAACGIQAGEWARRE
jgi:hypothetical protein